MSVEHDQIEQLPGDRWSIRGSAVGQLLRQLPAKALALAMNFPGGIGCAGDFPQLHCPLDDRPRLREFHLPCQLAP